MNDAVTIMDAYKSAYKLVHGTLPAITFDRGRFNVTTGTGSHNGYTLRDINNLVRGLTHLAKRAA